MDAKKHNLHMLEIVADGLGALLPDTVFVGGATTTLYVNSSIDESDSSVRPTDDVDCVVEIASRAEYRDLEKTLRKLGFKHAMEPGAPMCRWNFAGVTVDMMPTDPKILGFSNSWYRSGMDRSMAVTLPSRTSIRIFSAPYFLASKAEAFVGRGKGDFLGSRDFEDIITVLDGRTEIRSELGQAPDEVKTYLRNTIESWARTEGFLQNIIGHLPFERRTADGARRVVDIIRGI